VRLDASGALILNGKKVVFCSSAKEVHGRKAMPLKSKAQSKTGKNKDVRRVLNVDSIERFLL
jgi:hypothetical protein